jgi:hypothetical protein
MKRKSLKIVITIILLISPFIKAFGTANFKDQLGVALGMVNSSFSQQEDVFSKSATTFSGSVAVISLDLCYEIFTSRKRSYFFRGTASGIAGEVSKYYAISSGQRFYFGADGVSGIYIDPSIKITINPVFRYYAGWAVGIFSTIYEPGEGVRSDIGIEIGGFGGILYSKSKTVSYKAELTILKGTGIETTTMDMQVFFGATFFI